MNKSNMYDQFSQDYDRFVNWHERLNFEIPFLTQELSGLSPSEGNKVTVLDTACGTGHHAIALTAHGFDCSGADISAGMIVRAQENAEMANVDIQFQQVGFMALSSVFGKNAFDGILCLGNSLPHIVDEVNIIKALGDFHTVLCQGGKLVLQNLNFDKIMAQKTRWLPPQTHREDDKIWVFNRFYDFETDGTLTFNIQTLFSQSGSDFEHYHSSTRLLPLRKERLEILLQKVNFKQLRFFGDLSGSKYDQDVSGNLVIIATAEK